jgi:hypothetical protein
MLRRIFLGLSLLLVVSIETYSQTDRQELPFSQEIFRKNPPTYGYHGQSARVAFPSGNTKTYWLYDTYTNRDGNSTEIGNQIVPRWLEDMGYTVDYDKIRSEESDEKFIISAVKTVMTQRNCDVAVSVELQTIRHWSFDGTPNQDIDYIGFVIINKYDRTTRRYSYTYIPTTIMNIGR